MAEGAGEYADRSGDALGRGGTRMRDCSKAVMVSRLGKILIATHNAGKLREFAALLGPLGWDVTSAGEMGLAEAEETAADFAGNARLKALAAAVAAGIPALADDSGLCVAALGGGPGVFSA